MKPLTKFLRQDRPISSVDGDALARGPLVANLVRALISEDQSDDGRKNVRATGFTVGLTGEWGAGKSSVLYLLGQHLSRLDRVIVTTLNPWLFKGRDELIQAYFNGLRAALGRSSREEAAALTQQLERYREAIDVVGSAGAAALDTVGGGGTVSLIWRALGRAPKSKSLSPDEERAALERKLAAADVAVVVLIDELDRVEDDEVRAVAQLVKAVGDIKGISYLVAYDHRRVALSLGRGDTEAERLESGAAYLEKIIQFAIPLGPLFSEDVRALLEASLEQNGVTLPTADRPHQQGIVDGLVNTIRTPREVKRLAGAFAVLEEIVRGEICPYDVLGYSWLATKLPEVRQRIADNIEAIVDDPGEIGMIRRLTLSKEDRDKTKLFDSAFGQVDEDHREVLCLLFPQFAEQEGKVEGDRLAKRRNLVRLLYLGDPPGMVSRREVDALWCLPTEDEVEAALQPFQDADRLRSLLERVADFLPSLPMNGDATFWLGLSRALIRPHDWINGPETRGAATEDAADMLWNMGRRGSDEAIRVRTIMGGLVANGDLLLVPWLLRRHLFALNMVKEASGRTEQVFMSEAETHDLLLAEEPRYRSAVLDGTMLRRLPDTEIMYTLSNAGRWDEELRDGLTGQLCSMASIATFAALTVRPGYIATFESMSGLLDASVVSQRIRRIVATEGLPGDEWLAASIMRLQAVLLRLDPTFIGRRSIDIGDRDFEALFGNEHLWDT